MIKITVYDADLILSQFLCLKFSIIHYIMQNNSSNKFQGISCKIRCIIERVVASKQGNYFVMVQLKTASSQNSIKLRTQISALTNRPNFTKNQFSFIIGAEPSTLKFGLMKSKSQLDSDANTAMVYGVASVPFTLERISQLQKYEFKSSMIFSERGKETGQFHLTIKADEFKKLSQSQVNAQNFEKAENYNPLISRILYDDNVTDFSKLKNSISALENQLIALHEDLKKSKKEEAFYEKIYLDLESDENEIKDEIDRLEKINSKIEYSLGEKESLENLKIEIDLLSQSEEGKGLLLQKLEYFQDRIYRQIEQNEKLSIEYKKIRPELQYNLQKAEQHATKLKNKQIQQFQIQKNQEILKSYEDILYQFKCNEQAINSLANMSKKSQLTAQQAKLLLSQAKYQVRLLELNPHDQKRKNFMGEEKIMREIQREMMKEEDAKDKLSQQQEMVYKIKLSALQKQIGDVKKKISQFYITQKF